MNPKQNMTKELSDDGFQDILNKKKEIEAPCNPSHYRVLQRVTSNPDNYLVVSFGGGSAPGLAGNTALMGLLDELDLKKHVKEIWGSSAGAIVGSAWSVGVDAHSGLKMFDDIAADNVLDISRWEVFVKGMFNYFFKKKLPEGFIQGKKFRKHMRNCVENKSFSQTDIPLRLLAVTDDGHARKIVFKEGSIVEAVMASMCLPGACYPVQDWNGKPYGYFDGGIAEKTPLNCIINDYQRSGRKQNLVVICTHFSHLARIKKPVGFMQRFMSVLDSISEDMWEATLFKVEQIPNCKVLILNPHIQYGTGFDFSNIRNNYLWSRKQFKEQLSNSKLAQRFSAH